MARDVQQIHEFQKQLTSSQDVLKDIFFEALRDLDADQGFLAFEDTNRYLSIVVSKGDYWHLPSHVGMAGRCFTNGKAIISDPNDPEFKQTEGGLFSEIIMPVFQGDNIVGVLLMDNHKKRRFNKIPHQQTLEKYTKKIKEVLDQREPWGFRDWWLGHQRRKYESLVDKIKIKLNPFLKDFENVWGVIGLVSEGGKIEKPIKIGESTLSTSIGGDEPIEKAVHTGDYVLIDEPIKKYECIIPFPLEGPVIGVIKLESYEEHTFSRDTVRRIQDLIREINYDHLSPAATIGSPDSEFFFKLVHMSFNAHESSLQLHEILFKVAEQAKVLCDSNVRIGFVPQGDLSQQPKLPGPIFMASNDELKNRFHEKLGKRPRCFDHGDWLRCPVYIENNFLVAVVEVESKSSIDNRFNRPLMEILSVMVRQIIIDYSRRDG